MATRADTIPMDELRRLLAAGERVRIVDIRDEEDFDEWSIPGSENLPVMEDVARGKMDALDRLDLEGHAPLVTVCYQGVTSRTAARALAAHGAPAQSLEGGMNAWSLAWNTAEAELDTGTTIVQVRRAGKGCLSYIVGSGSGAAVVDPCVDVQVYADEARTRGWTITHVLETHIHADHLSRARQLARETSARLVLPANDRARFDHASIAHGETLAVGDARLQAIATPGHTDESVTYLVDDEAALTGDTLFVDAVGRPDLETDPAGARERAARLHESLGRLARLSGEVLVLPAHTSSPPAFDGKLIGAPLADVVAATPVLSLDRDAFVERLTVHLPPTPPNHATIVEMNEQGADVPEDPTELEAGANRCAAG